MAEQRRFSRFTTTFAADMVVRILLNGREYMGRLEDISVKGMYVSVYDKLPINAEVDIELTLADRPMGPLVRCHGRVARSKVGGAGLEITGMSESGFLRLKEIVTSLSADPDQVERELRQFAETGT